MGQLASRNAVAPNRCGTSAQNGRSVSPARKSGSLLMSSTTTSYRFAASSRRTVGRARDRKSTRLNSSHSQISYAVFCLKKKKVDCIHRSTAPQTPPTTVQFAPPVNHTYATQHHALFTNTIELTHRP